MSKQRLTGPDRVTIMDSFPGIAALKNALARHHPLGTLTFKAKDPATREAIDTEIPRWLFRGESCPWPTSLSSIARLRAHAHPVFKTVPKEHHDRFFRAIENIALRATSSMGKWLDLNPMSSAGFAQHYGLPSEFLDFSRSLEVAIGFAVDDPERWQDSRQALVAVLDVRQAVDRAVIADLSSLLEWARRPAAQCAYGFHHRTHVDLKSRLLADDVGLIWYEVTIQTAEAREHRLLDGLIDAHKDPAAGILQLVIDELASHDRGWPTPLASYLADIIPPAPFVMRRDPASGSGEITGTMCPAEEAGLSFDEQKERALNRHLWSQAYTQRSPEERHRALVEMRAAA